MNLPPINPKEQLQLDILQNQLLRILEDEYFFSFIMFATSFFTAMFSLESLGVFNKLLG